MRWNPVLHNVFNFLKLRSVWEVLKLMLSGVLSQLNRGQADLWPYQTKQSVISPALIKNPFEQIGFICSFKEQARGREKIV